MALRRLAVANVHGLAADPDDVGDESRTRGGLERDLQGPVLAGREGADLPLSLHDHAQRHGLDTAGGEAPADLARQERAERVPDEAVDDPPGLLRVDKVLVDVAGVGERLPDRAFGDLVERHAPGLGRRDVGRLGHVPGDRLTLTVKVGREEDIVGALRGLLDGGHLLATVVGNDILGREVVVDVDAELALARVLGQIPDVAVRGEDLVVRSEVALDRPRLGGRLHDHEVLGHGGRECSTGPSRAGHARTDGQMSRIRCRKSSSISRSTSTSPSAWSSSGSAMGTGRRCSGRSGTAPADGSPVPLPARIVGAAAHLGAVALKLARRDLEEADRPVREEERRLRPVDEDRPLAVHAPEVRAHEPGIACGRDVEQVREERLLVGDVDADVADHVGIVAHVRRRRHRARWSHRGRWDQGQGW